MRTLHRFVAALGLAASLASMGPANAIRRPPTLATAYEVSQTVYAVKANEHYHYIGLLYFSGGVGYLVLASLHDDGTVGPGQPLPVDRFETIHDDSIVLEAGAEYRGHVTPTGFAVHGTLVGPNETWETDLTAEAHQESLTAASGLYTLTATLVWYFGTVRFDDSAHWSGTAALAMLRDTAYMALVFHRSRGTEHHLDGVAPLDSDGTFRIISDDKRATFHGRVSQPGLLRGQWSVFTEDSVHFEGEVEGKRF